jgi:hypothetical protein
MSQRGSQSEKRRKTCKGNEMRMRRRNENANKKEKMQ